MGRFIKKHRISMTYTEVPAFMICRVDDHKGQKHFILTFRNGSGGLLKIPYSQGAAVKGYPEVEDLLEGIASDILLVNEYQTAEAFCYGMGIPEDECQDIFDRLTRRDQDMRTFLGAEAYDELGELAIQDRFEMEGAAWWQRNHRTCGE